MNKVFGIDISQYQGEFDFKEAKKEGVEFVIIRAGFTGATNGISKTIDPKFERNYEEAKKKKIGVGAYWFSRATTYEDGKAEAQFLYEQCLKGKVFEYPIAIDVEDRVYQMKAGKEAVTKAIKGFCEYLEAKHYYVVIYSNVNWFKNYIDTDDLKQYDKWVASWGKVRPSYPENGMWQFGGSTNQIRSNEIAGVVCDQDYAYKDYPQIMKNKELNGYRKNPTIEYYPKTDYRGVSIVEALISIGVDSSYSYREKIAKANGIKEYRGSSSQNMQLLNLLKKGKLKKV